MNQEQDTMKMYSRGYTTGVFDLFHIGHLNILRHAKERCHYLIVGVSTDELVMSYKKRAPIIPYAERAEIVRSIRYVDEVVPQHTIDKHDALDTLQFDVMFHGDDWKGTPLWADVERRFAEARVDIIYFPYTKNTSSTLIQNAVRLLCEETMRSPDMHPRQ